MESSGIGQAITELSKSANFELDSKNLIRNGFMAVVIDVSNKLVKRTEQVGAGKDAATTSEDLTVIDYLDTVKEWKEFVDGELDASNKKNKRTLGGSTRPVEDETNDDENGYDVQMDKIMARFNNFNRILSQSSKDEDDDDEEEEENTNDEASKSSSETWDEDDDDDKPTDGETRTSEIEKNKDEPGFTNNPNGGVAIQKVEVPEQEDLVSEYSDSQFWKVDKQLNEDDVDALLAELEN